jgi:eukaryotic-like serine/threonine-protein kinase
MLGSDSGDDHERRLNEAAAHYFELQAAGKQVDRQRWLSQYPDLANELDSFLSDLDFVSQARRLEQQEHRQPARERLDNAPVVTQLASTALPNTLQAVPTGVGPYVNLASHARGGLGEVFQGTDPLLHRKVAVKRLQDRLANDAECRRRFLLEAEVTARLEHPGVVPVFGLFWEEGGRPAYAMRFVQGPTLWDAIQAYHTLAHDALVFRRLLQSVVNVCQTIAYAHSRGIIHRDLKPQNIMIGKFGEALVLDWGLAKIVGRPEEARTSEVSEETLVPGSGSGSETELGSAVGTPGYMSPEQAAGRWDVVDHAADIYGLGAVLYALLTAKPPMQGGNWPELQQRIQRGDFPRPRLIQPRVSAALEAICLKAMAIVPANRYSSASALAVDLEHWLADEPVSAFPENSLRRGRRWMKRHRGAVLAGMLLLLTALGATSVGLLLLGKKNQEILAERNAARQAAEESEAVNSFLADDLLGQADPDENSRDQQVTVEAVLAKAAASIDGNPKFADKPGVEASLQLVMGKTYLKLGNMPEAERHLRRAMELRRAALGLDSSATLEAQEALANFLNLGPERFEESIPLARETWQARKRVLGPDDPATLDSLNTYASSLITKDKDEALKLFHQCVEAQLRTLGPEDPKTLGSLNNLGLLLFFNGDLTQAAELLRKAVAGRENQPFASESMACVGNLANTLFALGELNEAESLLGRYIPLTAKLLSAEHLFTRRLEGVQARVWIDQGHPQLALAKLPAVIDCFREQFPEGSWRTAAVLVDLGRAQLVIGNTIEAEKTLAEARDIYSKSTPPNDYYSGWADCCHAQAKIALQQLAEAEPLLVSAEQRLSGLASCPRRHYAKTLESLAQLYDARQMPDEAKRWREKLAVFSKAN